MNYLHSSYFHALRKTEKAGHGALTELPSSQLQTTSLKWTVRLWRKLFSTRPSGAGKSMCYQLRKQTRERESILGLTGSRQESLLSLPFRVGPGPPGLESWALAGEVLR